MQEPKGLVAIFRGVLNKPFSSVALMGVIGLLGISTGFISYQEQAQSSQVSQALDTALPAMSNKGFKNNKYDNAYLIPSEGEQDSIFLPDLSGKEVASKQQIAATYSKKVDSGFTSNENVSAQVASKYEASQGRTITHWKNRNRVRSHYNNRLSERTHSNEQIIGQMTAPAPLSASELANRQSTEASLERAAQLERMAINQLEMAQNGGMRATGTTAYSTPTDNAALTSPQTNGLTDTPAAQVTLANLDEYVEVPGNRPNNAFYGLKGERKQPDMIPATPVPNAIEAVIHGDADHVTVTNGSTIKLRLLQDIQVGNFLVPRNSLLSGECVISGERVQVLLSSLRVNSSIMPIKMRVYDIDGHAGIYVPDLAVKNQIAQTGAQTVTGGSLNMPYMIPSGGSMAEMLVGQTAVQGTNLAVNGIRTLAAKKMSQQKVTIRPNYRVYLKQDQN
jgi:conjugative transposon TraM protein